MDENNKIHPELSSLLDKANSSGASEEEMIEIINSFEVGKTEEPIEDEINPDLMALLEKANNEGASEEELTEIINGFELKNQAPTELPPQPLGANQRPMGGEPVPQPQDQSFIGQSEDFLSSEPLSSSSTPTSAPPTGTTEDGGIQPPMPFGQEQPPMDRPMPEVPVSELSMEDESVIETGRTIEENRYRNWTKRMKDEGYGVKEMQIELDNLAPSLLNEDELLAYDTNKEVSDMKEQIDMIAANGGDAAGLVKKHDELVNKQIEAMSKIKIHNAKSVDRINQSVKRYKMVPIGVIPEQYRADVPDHLVHNRGTSQEMIAVNTPEAEEYVENLKKNITLRSDMSTLR